MDTRNQRARRDARAWTFSRREIVTSIISGIVVWVLSWLAGLGGPMIGLLIGIGAAILVAILLPAGAYGLSWLAAVGRIHGEELASIHGEIAELRGRLAQRQENTEAIGRIKALRSMADVLGVRVQPWGVLPEGLDKEVDAWIGSVSEALAPWPEVRAQFDGVSDENAAVSAVLKRTRLPSGSLNVRRR